MKLRKGVILHEVGGIRMLVTTGEALQYYGGYLELNDTAYAIYQKLLTDTTEEAVVDALCQEYNVSRGRITAGVRQMVEKAERLGLMEEPGNQTVNIE